eukprot:TRINITY_DN23002_c0_g1_i1.p1 TRINITY_DN23002_c0_g1~~TRINITY_DN23002_c0_g1_i1.p1  ORF type:complete len:103 (-),score=20.81 TRINITY_DN23002_c0_g1_i1:31-339(-)
MGGTMVPYRLSKVSLNALTRIISDETKDSNILVNCVCPGMVDTDGFNANLTPQMKQFFASQVQMRSAFDASETAVWLATLGDDGPRGLFWGDYTTPKGQLSW